VVKKWATGAVVVGIAGILGCGGDTTEEMVRDALTASGIENVDVQAERGAIRLSGTVDTLADRSRAVELAAAIVGASTAVQNNISVSGLGPLEGRATPAETER
jgi:osmotically-inducible protein OsmY